MNGDKTQVFRLDQIIWKQTNRVEKHSIIKICKYLVNIISSMRPHKNPMKQLDAC